MCVFKCGTACELLVAWFPGTTLVNDCFDRKQKKLINKILTITTGSVVSQFQAKKIGTKLERRAIKSEKKDGKRCEDKKKTDLMVKNEAMGSPQSIHDLTFIRIEINEFKQNSMPEDCVLERSVRVRK